MNQHAFERVARRRRRCLGSDTDWHCFLRVGIDVDIHVTHAMEMLHHGDARMLVDELNQCRPPARNHKIEILIHRQKFADRVAVVGRHHFDRRFRQVARPQRRPSQLGQRRIGVGRFLTALEETSVPGFETQTKRVHRHIRARLVNHRDHTQRNTNLPHLKASRCLAFLNHLPDRIGKVHNLSQAVGHLIQKRLSQFQPLELRKRKVRRAGFFHVLAVGFEDRRSLAGQPISQVQKHPVLRVRRQRRQHKRGVAGGFCFGFNLGHFKHTS